MKIRKAYKFRLKPNAQQEALLISFSGHTRTLWNKALRINLDRLEKKQSIMYYQELDFWSKLWKQSEEYGYLNEAPAHILQQKLRDLDRAFRDCFDKTQPTKRLPRFKKRGVDDSFRFPEPKQVKFENKHITFPKLGRIKYYQSREVIGTIKNYTISRKGTHWFVAIQVEMELPSALQKTESKAIGLDMGIKHFVTTSEGEHIAPINSYRNLSHRLAIEQRRLSKKEKYSSNWKKQCLKVNNVHQKIVNTRHDFLHKLSSKISNNHAIIVVENLKVKNMSRSASGTVEAPGNRVSAKSGLNKSILDQGWFEFRRQLDYKSYWRGGMLVEVSSHYTSQQCSACGHTAKENRASQAHFVCMDCKIELNADVNAAKNILAAGHAVLACGASV